MAGLSRPMRSACRWQRGVINLNTVILLMALIFSWCGLVQAEIYRWTDAEGKLHFSDEPPADTSKAEAVELKPMSEYQTPELHKQALEFSSTTDSSQSRQYKAYKLEQEQKRQAAIDAKCERYREQHRAASYKIYNDAKAAVDGSKRQQQLRNKIIEYCY
ncbi:DUF4124 domain-containing protein [Oceanobacter mangrovi]|uniref:DUF4124 domain-containing protein n=1 Tax=Oceanobacter mangrovi TaxID=2862510 RepID=UPI001C8F18C3|nr:DUF4124 domain-containing protein [Oceanobacter mangrovi]